MDSEFHGWKIGDMSLHIGRVPGRLSVAVYTTIGNRATVHGYFRSDLDAREVMGFIDTLAEATFLKEGE